MEDLKINQESDTNKIVCFKVQVMEGFSKLKEMINHFSSSFIIIAADIAKALIVISTTVQGYY